MNLKRAFGLATAAAALLCGSACVMPDQLSQIQKDVADVRQQLRQVQEDQAQALSRLEALEDRSSSSQDRVTRADLADLAVRIDQVGRETSISDERINDLGRRLDGLSQDVEQLRSTSRPPASFVPPPPSGDGTDGDPAPAAGPAALPDAEALYNTAYADFSKGNYALAISGFEEYYEKFPESALADNALYWIGECHFSQGSFPDAVRAFDRLLEQSPRSDKAAAANLKKGLAYLEQNQIGQAIVQLRFVHSTYPGSDEAKIAKDKLTSLGAPL